MREILFRGRSVDTDEWVYGSFCIDALEQIGHPIEVNGFIRWYDIENKKVLMCEVERDTVGQYTGLCDKNGKKIFEGDIVKNIDGAFLVCWDKEKCAFIMRFLEYPYETLYLEEMWEDSEIIGNIHDNPELVKGGAE